MRCALQVWLLLMFCAGCSTKEPAAVFDPHTARNNILEALPTGWSVIPESLGQRQDSTGYFTDPRTDAFMLLGPKLNDIDWTDKQGKAHREALAKECLSIWIVPPDFTPKFPHWIKHSALPQRVFSSETFKVYGYVTMHIADTNRMAAIVKEATRVELPDIRLSWTNWRRDISASLKK